MISTSNNKVTSNMAIKKSMTPPPLTTSKRWTMATPLVAALVLCALLATLFAPSALAAGKISKCPAERDQEMDVCAAKLGFLGDHAFKAPTDLNDTVAYCSNLKASLACLQSYARDCLQGITKQVMVSILRRGRQQHSQLCQTDEHKREFIRKMTCLRGSNIDQYHSRMDGSIARFEFILEKVPTDSKFVSLCCSYLIFDRDLSETLNRICPVPAKPAAASGPKSDREASREFISKVVSSSAGEYYAMFCDSYQSLDECRNSPKTAGPLKGLEETTTKAYQGKVRPKSKSLVPIMLAIIGGDGQASSAASAASSGRNIP